MRLLLFSLIFLSTLFANPYENLTHYTLNNGLKVYLLPDKKAKNVHIEVEVAVGMKAENRENAGISHLVEHIVFRDQRIENSDYYNLIKDRGATDVNGYTSYYTTRYITTINPENAYWITKTFSKMLFDKNVSEEDLRVEKGALQIEIGEPNWTDKLSFLDIGKLGDFIGDLFPPQPSTFADDFGVDVDAEKVEYQSSATYKSNNKKFTLQEVMAHYNDYYYPANMRLRIVGDFDLEKMKQTIDSTFAQVKKGTGKTIKHPYIKDASLSGKPLKSYAFGGMTDSATVELGMKMIEDSPKKVLIVESYLDDLADRLNKEFRNKKGESYGVSGYLNSYHDAAIATIYFSSPHDAFDKNIKIAKEWMMKETAGDINDSTILQALKQRENSFLSVEHDVSSLMGTISQYEDFHKIYPQMKDKNPYQIFKEIKVEDFKKVLKETFLPEHSADTLTRDYRWFPYEGVVLFFVTLAFVIFILKKFFSLKIDMRKVKLRQKISSRWSGFFIIMISLILSALVYEWLCYGIEKFFGISGNWEESYDIPFAYLLMIVDLILSIAFVFITYRILFSWYCSQIYVSDEKIVFAGGRHKSINLKDIRALEVVPWSPKHWGEIKGVGIFFWRPMLKLVLPNETIYIRSSNAKHLKEDIEGIIKEK